MALRVGTVKKWQAEVNSGYKWLQYETSDGIIVERIFCSLCSAHEVQIMAMRNYSAAFVNGIMGSSLKKDNINKHFQSEMHQKALTFEKRSTAAIAQDYNPLPINRCFADVDAHERQRVAKLFDIAYTMAKLEIPYNNFTHIAKLEVRHGVDLGRAYITEIKCKEFTDTIGRVIEHDFQIALQQTPYFSLLIDSAAITSTNNTEMLYVLFVDKSGLPNVKFLGLKNVKYVNAEDLRNTVFTAFLDIGIDITNKLIGFMGDGSGYNLGMKKEASALIKQSIPFLVTIHCLNHHLELAARDTFKDTEFEDIIEMLHSLNHLYKNSPNYLFDLKPLSEIMEEILTNSEKSNGTRWVQYHSVACKTLLQLFPLIVSHLEALANEKIACDVDKSRHQANLRMLKSLKFVLNLLLFIEILDPLSKLSLSIQSDSVELLYATSLLEKFYSTLERINNGSMYGALRDLLRDAETDPKSVLFGGIRLNGDSVVLKSFQSSLLSYTEDIANCVKNRFDEFHKDDIFQCLKLLDINIWPTNKQSLEEYGMKELETFIGHFEGLLKMNNVDVPELAREWDLFKGYRLKSLTHLSKQELWQCVLTSYRDKFPNLYHMICILQSFPVSSSIIEKGFLSIGRMKSDYRNRFEEKSLEFLMRINIEGPEPEAYDSRPAVNLFFSQRRGPTICTYGKRTAESPDSNEEKYSPPEKKCVL